MKRRVGYLTDITSVLVLSWLGFSALPISTFWFDPGPVIIQDAFEGESPAVGFTRDIKRDVTMRYSVVIRNAKLAVVCEDRGGPFRYRADSTFPDDEDLAWWAPGCPTLPPGTYIVETSWTATDRWYGILLDRSISRESNVFEIFPRNASKPRSIQLEDTE